MSELLTDITAIAPYFTVAATTFGTHLAQEAAQRVATGTVDAGEGFFRRLFGRSSGEVPGALVRHNLPEEEVDLLLNGLSEADRVRLAEALSTWLRGGATNGFAPERLVEAVRAVHAEQSGPVTITTYGDQSPAIEKVGDNATFNFGGKG
ncbi:hypothetical protein ACFRMQ_24800 [Kitasatospora sp. NPDC056783]|uniref:hypothetical protein n=1 Tax=Kitasatospora sp. NPDC056783 TaxID=3345943 RepID=UPI0036C64197